MTSYARQRRPESPPYESRYPLLEDGQCVALDAVLSLVTRLNVCRGGPKEISAVAERILGYELADDASEDPAVWAFVRAEAIKRWPQLAGETGAGVHRENWRGWVRKREDRYGTTLPLKGAP